MVSASTPLVSLVGVFYTLLVVVNAAVIIKRSSIDSWISEHYGTAEAALKRNIGSSSNTAIPKGVVIASPSTSAPDYYFQWIRDASCVMEHLVDNYLESGQDLSYIMDWIEVQKKLQRLDNPSGGYTTGGLGEPKFHVDSTAYTDPWGRPQRDGPALRANTLMKFATRYLTTDGGFVRSQLYDSAPQGQSQTVIKADLDYVVSSWSQSSFDLWEEIQGQHYYTTIVSYRAMVEGAAFAQKLGDSAAAGTYKKTAESMLDTIHGFWSAEKGYIVETHGIQGRSGLDCGVLLGVLRSPYVFTPGSEQALATTEAMVRAFEGLYPINQRNSGPGFGIGRYPEDTYDGVSTSSKGNPWFICTATVAHTIFAATSEFTSASSISVTPTSLGLFKRAYSGAKEGVYKSGSSDYNNIIAGFKRLGDGFLEVLQRHGYQNGSFAEQFDRENGFNRGARDLTWSYEAVLGAMRARKAVV
ncbi:Glucoamylase [Orbilia brochopaga]|nr:Glucoamylase [Drechslerella brochopaga]